jgi:hypothetical protein
VLVFAEVAQLTAMVFDLAVSPGAELLNKVTVPRTAYWRHVCSGGILVLDHGLSELAAFAPGLSPLGLDIYCA